MIKKNDLRLQKNYSRRWQVKDIAFCFWYLHKNARNVRKVIKKKQYPTENPFNYKENLNVIFVIISHNYNIKFHADRKITTSKTKMKKRFNFKMSQKYFNLSSLNMKSHVLDRANSTLTTFFI